MTIKVLLYERGYLTSSRRTNSIRRDEATAVVREKFVFALQPHMLHEASCQLVLVTKSTIGTKFLTSASAIQVSFRSLIPDRNPIVFPFSFFKEICVIEFSFSFFFQQTNSGNFLGTKRTLGRITLGHRHFFSTWANSTGLTTGIDHWHDMAHRSGVSIERWHPIL